MMLLQTGCSGLLALIHEKQTAFNRAMVGQVLPVLLEKVAKRPGQLVGRSPYLQPVHVDADASCQSVPSFRC